MPEPTCDLLVIGAGPAGCTAALYGARAGLRTVLSSPTALSGMMAKAPLVANFPGQLEAVPGREILARLRTQALRAGAVEALEAISAVDLSTPGLIVAYGGPDEHRAGALIVATGAMGRADKVPGEDEFLGRGVAYCAACDGPFFAGEHLLVVGDDAQATEEALALAKIAASVCLVCPGEAAPGDAPLQQAIGDCPELSVRTGLALLRIVGEDAVRGALFRTREGEECLLEAAGVFLYLHGAAPATDFLAGAVAADEDGYLLTDELLQTSVPGVFAAGDVRRKQVRQMVVAAADGATAALAAERYLRRREHLRSDRGSGPVASRPA